MQLRMNSTIYLLAAWRLRGALFPIRSEKTNPPLRIVEEKSGTAGGSPVDFILSNILNWAACYRVAMLKHDSIFISDFRSRLSQMS